MREVPKHGGAVRVWFTRPERLALAGFLTGYTGLTREAVGLHGLAARGQTAVQPPSMTRVWPVM